MSSTSLSLIQGNNSEPSPLQHPNDNNAIWISILTKPPGESQPQIFNLAYIPVWASNPNASSHFLVLLPHLFDRLASASLEQLCQTLTQRLGYRVSATSAVHLHTWEKTDKGNSYGQRLHETTVTLLIHELDLEWARTRSTTVPASRASADPGLFCLGGNVALHFLECEPHHQDSPTNLKPPNETHTDKHTPHSVVIETTLLYSGLPPFFIELPYSPHTPWTIEQLEATIRAGVRAKEPAARGYVKIYWQGKLLLETKDLFEHPNVATSKIFRGDCILKKLWSGEVEAEKAAAEGKVKAVAVGGFHATVY